MLDWLLCALVKSAGWCLCRVPPGAAVWLGERLGALAYWLQPKRTRIGLLNLRAAFDGRLMPRQARRILRASYRQLGAGLVELLRLPVMDTAYIDRYITIEGRGRFEQAAASGKPVILLTGHYGNWELSSIAAALYGFPVVALARAQNKFPRLYRLLVSYRESKGATIVQKGGAMKRLIAALEARRLVGIVADQASRQGVFVPFFGRPALFATGPFELARSRRALLVPVFIHRRRGPFHRIVVEPPFELARDAPKTEAIYAGIERFAGALSRNITDDPGQWLWMHKRWKYTTARRVLVLSDGRTGHLKQSLAVVEALRQRHPELASDVIEIRYRHRLGRLCALLWSWWAPAAIGAAGCLQRVLVPATAKALLCRYADVVVSCGSSTVAVNLLWARENDAKSIVVMNPAPVPLRRFDLVIAPRHDRLPHRPNIVQLPGALAGPMTEERLRAAAQRLKAHPRFRSRPGASARQPAVAVLIGGDTAHYELTPSFADALINQVAAACDELSGACLVTTSRRTSPAVERLLSERLRRHPRCRLLLIASQDAVDGTLEGMLGAAEAVVVTGESVSMVSEACASGRHVIVVEPPLRQRAPAAATKHKRFLEDLAGDGYVRVVPVPEVALAIRRLLRERSAAKRLNHFAMVSEAVGRLLL